MPTSTSPPPLEAILLTITTRSGPRLVFHYPARPTPPAHPSHDTALASTADEHNTDYDAFTDDSHRSSDPHTPRSHSSPRSTASAPTSASDSDDTRRFHRHSTHAPGLAQDAPSTTARGVPRRPPPARRTTTTTTRKARTLREEGPAAFLDETGRRRGGGGGPSSTALGLRDPLAMDDDGNGDGSNGHYPAGAEDGPLEWERLLGYPTSGLEKLLCPPGTRAMRKQRFEVALGEVVLLGHPVWVRGDGLWRKDRGRKKTADKPEEEKGLGARTGSEASILTVLEARAGEKSGPEQAVDTDTDAQATSTNDESDSEGSSSSGDGAGESDMTMFHVVFALRPLPLEHQARIQQMYDHVVRKLSKALKYAQARTGWVWKESRAILEAKSRAKDDRLSLDELWSQILDMSLLARCLAHVFDAISTNAIARVTIDSTVDASMQIPQVLSTAQAPTPADPQTLGLTVTSASMLDSDGRTISPHCALLLLEDRDVLLKEIESDDRELAGPLAFFIREVTPTKSLLKMATKLKLRITDLQYLARHLIYWRRARAIAPLHIRDLYIISPLADMSLLKSASAEFDKTFPGLPGLLSMLQSLGARPLPYGYLIPSQDHKEAYMDMLAWLVKGNWVTQLRTFAWIRVSKDVKLRAAQRTKSDLQKITGRERSKRDSIATVLSGSSRDRKTDDRRSGDDMKSPTMSLLSPMLKPYTGIQNSEDDGIANSRGPSPLAQVTSPFETAGSDEPEASPKNEPTEKEPKDVEESLIMSPQKADAEEAQWLSVIEGDLDDDDVRKSWSTLLRYFDGERALEEIAGRENIKRSKVATMLARLERQGILCIARHW